MLVGSLTSIGCASGTKFSDMPLPPLAQGQGRIIFYRDGTPVGMAVQPSVKLNGESIGKSQPMGFFFVDRPAGSYEVACTTEWEHKTTVQLAENETRYVRTFVTIGVIVGHIWPELVEPTRALDALQDCRYIGPPLSQTPSSQPSP
jgi:hypothetical protein